MKLSFTTAFSDAVGSWRRDSSVLAPLAGATMFLPQYAVLLLVPSPTLSDAGAANVALEGAKADPAARQAVVDAMSAWLSHYGIWYALAPLVGLFGGLTVMALYLAPGRLTLGRAFGRGAALLLRYLLASLLIVAIAGTVLMPGTAAYPLLVVLMPLAFYVLGRTMLAGPAIVAEAPLGAVAAIRRSWLLTSGHGWLLAATYAAPLFAAQLIGSALLPLAEFGGGNPVIAAIVDGGVAIVLAMSALTLALVEVTVYRRLANRGT